MSSALSARPKPCLVRLTSGRAYLWCACGRSSRQPFCDGSHRGTGIEPRKLVANRDEEVLLCGCKRTADAPFCDGTHNDLPGGSPLDDPDSPANRAIARVTAWEGPRRWLNGGCCVISPERARKVIHGGLRLSELVNAKLGARFQDQVLLKIEAGRSPVLSFGARDVILFVTAGRGLLIVSGRRFDLRATDGAYVAPGEAFQLAPAAGSALSIFAVASPQGGLEWPALMPDNFDDTQPRRVVSVDERQRVTMGRRYFQRLVDKRIGSRVITQFIGHIPVSKAAPHRHLYEETLIVVSGEGCVWTEDRKSDVRAGEVIFLPRKQLHSLQAVSAGGMLVAGVICPGDNPSINYYD